MTASQPNCAHCSHELNGFLETHVCPKCGLPQPLSERDDYFSVLGERSHLHLDTARLEKRFYEISRLLHPDRFAAAEATNKAFSVERMSRVNDAYRTLKNPSTRRAYFLELHGIRADAKQRNSQIPAALAEGWFELQDSLAETSEDAPQKLTHFEKALEDFKHQAAQKTQDLEAQIERNLLDPAPTQSLEPLLEALASQILSENYLSSLTQDIERIKKRLNL